MSFLKDIQVRFKKGSIVEQLIYINIGMFILSFLFNTLEFLTQSKGNLIFELFELSASYDHLLYNPWTIISYGFLHSSFLHILFNLIMLYYFGRLFIDYFTPKQLLNFYILGTLFGGILFVLSYNYFPVFDGQQATMVGASAGIYAIVIGIATHIPNYQLQFRFIGFVKLWHIAAIFVLLDIIQIPAGNSGGHIAHLGGAIFGFLYVSQASNKELNLFGWLTGLFKTKRKPLKTVHKSKKKTAATPKHVKPDNQQKIDGILDKISKSGYDTLTKEEKEFLFKQGK